MSNTVEKVKKERTVRSAREKCQAVLSLWMRRRRPSEICKELNIPANLLSNWQERALEGMLGALEPRTRRQEERGPMLDPRMEQLLERKVTRLQTRLARMGGKSRPGPQKPEA